MQIKRSRLIVTAGALLSLVWYGGILTSPSSFALGQPAPALQGSDTRVCPLSPEKEKHSIDTFAKPMPVFTHPRCINCHGGVNPFAANGNHLGGRIWAGASM